MNAEVTNRTSLDVAVARTERELGALGNSVNAAGVANANPAEEMGEEQYQTLMDINMKGIFFSCQAKANAMMRHGKGSIINIASMSGVIVNRGLMQVHYNASKAGVIHMSKSMAMERYRGQGQLDQPGLHGNANEHTSRKGSPDEGIRKSDADATHGDGG